MARPGLFQNQKFKHLCSLLAPIPRPHVVGLLETLWHVCYESGKPDFTSASQLEASAEWNGEAGSLGKALELAGFIDATETGFTIHDFWDHAPRSTKLRKEREDSRKNKKVRTPAHSVRTSTPVVRECVPLPTPDTRLPTPLKKEEAPPPPLVFPENLDTPEFRGAWKDWERHRIEIKKPMQPTSKAGQIAMLARKGHDPGIALIRHTIAMGWQGLREPEQPRDAPRSTLTPAERRNAEFERALEAVK